MNLSIDLATIVNLFGENARANVLKSIFLIIIVLVGIVIYRISKEMSTHKLYIICGVGIAIGVVTLITISLLWPKGDGENNGDTVSSVTPTQIEDNNNQYITSPPTPTLSITIEPTQVPTIEPTQKLVIVANHNNIAAGRHHTVAIKNDGTVVATGDNSYGQCDVGNWRSIVSVCADDDYTIGLTSDGRVLAVGENMDGQCNVNTWSDIIAIYTSSRVTIGLKANGTVVATGNNTEGQCNVEGWSDIIDIYVNYFYTAGLKADGTVITTNGEYQFDRSAFESVNKAKAGETYDIRLNDDGTITAEGDIVMFISDWNKWTDLAEVASGVWHIVGIKHNGTVVADDMGHGGSECDVEGWSNIRVE